MTTPHAPLAGNLTLAWICVLSLSLAGCAHRGSTLAGPPPAGPKVVTVIRDPESLQSCRKITVALAAAAPNEAAPPTGNALELLSISPPEGRAVTAASVIIADVSYGAMSFAPGQLRLTAQFESVAGVSPDPLHTLVYPTLTDAAGTVRFCVPLAEILLDPSFKKPLSLRFVLIKGADPSTRTVIARSEVVSFPTAP